MKLPGINLQSQYPSHIGCFLLLGTFSFYCYRNIFLQSEVGFKLPTVNLVSALNHFEAFVALPSTERFDLYNNLGKTFEVYKEDYMEHYEDYLLLLNNYLILGESQIALKYYAYKHYLNESYQDQDPFILGPPIIEFNKNFNDPIKLSTDREHNLINQHYHNFGIKDSRKICETFFNNYICPLYKSQSNWTEVEVAKSLSSILNHWILTKRLQIVCFFGSLIIIIISFIYLLVREIQPDFLVKNQFGIYFFAIFYCLIYISLLVLSFINFSITLITYHSNLNFKGLHNSSFNILQLLLICLSAYTTYCWMDNFKTKTLEENNKWNSEIDELKTHLYDLKNKANSLSQNSLNSKDKNQEPSTNTKNNETIETSNKNFKAILNSSNNVMKTLVDNVKRIVTPATRTNDLSNEFAGYIDESGPTLEDIQRIIYYTNNNQSTLNTGVNNETLIPITEENGEEIVGNDKSFVLENFKTLNVVSAISVNQPNCLPFTKTESSFSNYSSSPVDLKFERKSPSESIIKSLDEKRKGFWHYHGYSLNQGDYESVNSSKITVPESLVDLNRNLSMKTQNSKQRANKEKFHYNLKSNKNINMNSITPSENNSSSNVVSPELNIQWEKKFGLESPQSKSEKIHDSISLKGNSSQLYISKPKTLEQDYPENSEGKKCGSGSSGHISGDGTNTSINQKAKVEEIKEKQDKTIEKLDDSQVKAKEKNQKSKRLSNKYKEKSKIKYEFFLPSTTTKSESTLSSANDEPIHTSFGTGDKTHMADDSSFIQGNQDSCFSVERFIHEQKYK